MGRGKNRNRSDSVSDLDSPRDYRQKRGNNIDSRRDDRRRRDSLDSRYDRKRRSSLDSRRDNKRRESIDSIDSRKYRRRRDSYDSRYEKRKPYEQPRYGGRDQPYDIHSQYSYYTDSRRNSEDSFDDENSLKFEGAWSYPACQCFTNCTGICCAYCCPLCYICHLFQASQNIGIEAFLFPCSLCTLRTEVRTRSRIKGSIVSDYIAMCCCPWTGCYLVQLANEIYLLNEQTKEKE